MEIVAATWQRDDATLCRLLLKAVGKSRAANGKMSWANDPDGITGVLLDGGKTYRATYRGSEVEIDLSDLLNK